MMDGIPARIRLLPTAADATPHAFERLTTEVHYA